MALDFSVFCKNTYDGEPVSHCLTAPFGFTQNEDPSYLDWLFKAWGWTIIVALLSLCLALFFGLLIGTLRTLPPENRFNSLMSKLASTWIELFRDIPILVQVFLWYHVIPAFILPLKSIPTFWLVSFALGFFTSSRIAEQVRSGIQSLASGQRMAGKALGLTLSQSYRYVILPQSLRIIIPPLTSECMNLIKNSSVAFVVSVPELTQFAMQSQEETARGIEIYLAVSITYAISALTISYLMNLIEKHYRLPGFSPPSSAAMVSH
jgi:glutamate/aspartate transport system permease protein